MTTESFWKRVDKSGDCWIWTGWKSERGYGLVSLGGKKYTRATRIAWEMTRGPIPEGMEIRHVVCHNPSCVRPDHLEPGTHKQNMQDMVAAGRSARGDRSGARRHPEVFARIVRRGDQHHARLRPECMARGERHGSAKLSATDVAEIRRRLTAGESQRSLARAHAVSQSTIWQIATGRSWNVITPLGAA